MKSAGHEKNLKAASVEAGLTGVVLAARFRVSPQTISKWLNRRVPVPDKRKKEFAAVIGVDIEDLLPPEIVETAT
jgi:transcriptional regulator with XRE-family HTH domain